MRRSLTILFSGSLALFVILSGCEWWLLDSPFSVTSQSLKDVNRAGRNRMLSQRIAKDALAIRYPFNEVSREKRAGELQTALHDFEETEMWLEARSANSPEINHLLAQIESPYQLFVMGAEKIVRSLSPDGSPKAGSLVKLYKGTNEVRANENDYVQIQEQIVKQLETEGIQAESSAKLLLALFTAAQVFLVFLVWKASYKPAIQALEDHEQSQQALREQSQAAYEEAVRVAETERFRADCLERTLRLVAGVSESSDLPRIGGATSDGT